MAKHTFIIQNLVYITYLAEVLPLILCLIFLAKIRSKVLKVFLVYVVLVSFFLSIVLYYKYVHINTISSSITKRWFLCAEFSSLSLLYFYLLRNKVKKFFFITANVFFLLFSYYDYLISKPLEFSFLPLVVECFFFIVIIIFYFYEQIQYSFSKPIFQSPGFWISLAFLIYFSGNFFVFLFSGLLFKNPDFKLTYNIIYTTVTITKNILLATAVVINAYFGNEDLDDKINTLNIDLGTFLPLTHNTPNLHKT